MTEITLAPIPAVMHDRLDMFVCGACHGSLRVSSDDVALECARCGRAFTSDRGIPRLFVPDAEDSTTPIIQDFYEGAPFPNYDDIDSIQRLRARARQTGFVQALDQYIAPFATILECGCGTGQLSNFLAATMGRTVFGTDATVASLWLAAAFARKQAIARACFFQMNLFRPVLRPACVDVVICNGVLHHTSDPARGLACILTPLKKGGIVVVGLYNVLGRIPTDVRRHVFRWTGDRFQFLDPRLRVKSGSRRRAWFLDQYKHPHESKHSFDEVLGWFDASGVEFVQSIPSCTGEPFTVDRDLFAPAPRGTRAHRWLAQFRMLLHEAREGGLFIMIGRKAR